MVVQEPLPQRPGGREQGRVGGRQSPSRPAGGAAGQVAGAEDGGLEAVLGGPGADWRFYSEPGGNHHQ